MISATKKTARKSGSMVFYMKMGRGFPYLESCAATTEAGPKLCSMKSSLKAVAEAMPSRKAAIMRTNCCAVKPLRTLSERFLFSGMSKTHIKLRCKGRHK